MWKSSIFGLSAFSALILLGGIMYEHKKWVKYQATGYT